MPKKTEKEALWDFLTSIFLQNIKKVKGRASGDIKKFSKKISQRGKKVERGTL